MNDSHSASVVLCSYNGEKFLRAQLDSIAQQTHPIHEIIICDDHSEDSTPQIIHEFAAATKIPVRFHINPTRLGVTKNFEKGIGLATGDIIFLSDQDDLWHPNKVARMMDRFNQSDVALIFSNGRVIHEDLTPAGYTLWDSVWFNPTEQKQIRAGHPLPVLLRHAIAAGATMAFAAKYRSLILPIPDLPHCHDIWIALLLACCAKIDALNENLIDYRLHERNEVGLKHHGLLSQIKMARWQIRFGAFRYAVDLHQAALDRLKSSEFYIPELTIQLLNEKIAHSQIRNQLPSLGIRRLAIVWGEMKNGRYSRYSYGYKSVLQDLFLR